MERAACAVVVIAGVALGACDRVQPPAQETAAGDQLPLMWRQSVLAPAGPNAEALTTLSWVLFAGAAVIFLFVAAVAGYALFTPDRHARWLASNRALIGLGVAFPVVVLSILVVYSARLSHALVATDPPVLRIEVIGEQFWWRVHYLDAAGKPALVTANEIRMPTDRPVEFLLKSADVIHSFWVPNLTAKLDMIPGRTNVLRFAAAKPGIYRGQCAEYCGLQHALMALYVVAQPQAEFDAWFARQTLTPTEPSQPLTAQGRRLFIANGCGACHAVRGTEAEGRIGPDLTYVGSRLSLAAGTFPINRGTLAGWIASSQHLKPGNLMPSFGNLRGDELRAIAAYLESLK